MLVPFLVITKVLLPAFFVAPPLLFPVKLPKPTMLPDFVSDDSLLELFGSEFSLGRSVSLGLDVLVPVTVMYFLISLLDFSVLVDLPDSLVFDCFGAVSGLLTYKPFTFYVAYMHYLS